MILEVCFLEPLIFTVKWFWRLFKMVGKYILFGECCEVGFGGCKGSVFVFEIVLWKVGQIIIWSRCSRVYYFKSLSFWKVFFSTCDLALSYWEITRFRFTKIGSFTFNSCIEIGELVVIFLCSYCFVGRKTLIRELSLCNPPNEHLHWIQARLSLEFCIFTSVFPPLFLRKLS